ncbi:protoporphyrinogen oxidase HemJ [Profundibacterium mesophilum]|uniref:Protoporphyrinogen IX oxidase n=1 Tax=Profundibacterium mesophilum KAUST100406-0324 TaxID=1037889 RepID=A0A921TDK4_9RHOB|nr:protoporphyrinogen oxidase HemJ [Profundibacterium mesophilum]KAF0676317.1 membrane protein RHOS4 [Profundibacterium mesophilum KAUST100406-0324]
MDFLIIAYPWIKSAHVVSVIAWMAGLFYLPRLFVYHTERGQGRGEFEELFGVMENKLLRFIMNPAMIATWIFGLAMVATPGMIDWSAAWPWIKAVAVFAMTGFHMWCARHRRLLANGVYTREGSYYRKMNEVPTLLMLVIVVAVIARPF